MLKFGVSACFTSLLGEVVQLFYLVTSLLNGLPGDYRALEPPDSISNSEVKRRIADGSVGFPHVRVGHCQAHIFLPQLSYSFGDSLIFTKSACSNHLARITKFKTRKPIKNFSRISITEAA